MRFEEKMVFGKPASVSCGLDSTLPDGKLPFIKQSCAIAEMLASHLLFQNCT
jgi:hypothetical protein